MNDKFSEEQWQNLLKELFHRFPSFQQSGASAYKPGIENVVFFDQMAGHPHRQFKTIHVAGTNGKGSVSNMIASVLAAAGMRVGLYTSPHLLDFRERMRIREAGGIRYISKQEVADFVGQWKPTFEHLNLSFFEITTMMAFRWFADQKIDIAVIETGLGGRLDTTNIISPELSVITNIGLDHCDLLGETLSEIAFEKAGIIKPCIPVVVGESHPETDLVFERKTLYSNLSEVEFMGDRNRIMSLLTFADKTEPQLWDKRESILAQMDLQGSYQEKNLRTALAAVTVLRQRGLLTPSLTDAQVTDALVHTASRMDFHGRWEKISDDPYVLCDIGHNAHGLKYNFAQLQQLIDSGAFTSLTLVYGSVNDKAIQPVLEIFPKSAEVIFTQADNHRAMEAVALDTLYKEVLSTRANDNVPAATIIGVCPQVPEAVAQALHHAAEKGGERPLIYIGGSTYIVSEALPCFGKKFGLE